MIVFAGQSVVIMKMDGALDPLNLTWLFLKIGMQHET